MKKRISIIISTIFLVALILPPFVAAAESSGVKEVVSE